MTETPRQQDLGFRETEPINNVEKYEFEPPAQQPIKGYPELRWNGKRPFTSTVYYPAQHRETYGDSVDGWRNQIYWGDNLQVMGHLLKQYRGRVDLAYIDPPFDSNAEYKKTIRLKGKTISNDQNVFEEKQYTDIWTNDEYLQFMYERLILIRELLSDNGSIYLHCDYRKSHHLRCLLDEIFGSSDNNFRNEIVWKRTTARSDSTTYNHIHDTILFFSKSKNITWNQQHTQYSSTYLETNFKEDEKGRLYRETPLTAPGLRTGKSGNAWRGVNPGTIGKGRHWAIPSFVKSYLSPEAQNNPLQALDELDAIGRIRWAKDGAGRPNVIQYSDDLEGVELQSIWSDFGALSGNSSEAEEYPTQKPEALLDRIIKTSSNPGDLIFDCFMGSGTTQAVAMKLGRRFIGADINLGAIQITTRRLVSISKNLIPSQPKLNFGSSEQGEVNTFYCGLEVYNVNHYEIFRNPVEAKDLLLQALEINRLQLGNLFDGEKDGRMVKIMPITRIATRQDLNELINGFDYKAFERRQAERPTQPVERITLVCMGHEPGLAAHLQQEVPYKLDVEVVDILRDKQDLQFKRDSEARIVVQDGHLMIDRFYPMNLLSKLSMETESVDDWRELVESVMIDWNYDGAVLQPTVLDIPDGNELVAGRYPIPEDAGTIRVKITDLLSESLEVEVRYG